MRTFIRHLGCDRLSQSNAPRARSSGAFHGTGSPISISVTDTGAMPMATGVAPAHEGHANANKALIARLAGFDVQPLRREFARQGAFLHMRDFLPAEITTQLIAAVESVKPSVHRNYLPGHKQGGSVSRHAIDTL